MIPRVDRLNPPDDRRIPTRQVTLEKLVDGELESTIADAIPPPSTQDHDLLGHDNAYELTVGSGVNVVVGAGRARIDNTTYVHGTTAMALNVNATNYIKISAVGALFSSTSPASSGQIPLWTVTTNATEVTSFTDLRAVFSNGGGGGGGGASTLDQAYDGGGAGAGRIIDANDGAVVVRNTQADTNANLEVQRSVADINSLPAMEVKVDGESFPRLSVTGDTIKLGGTGLATPDVSLYRSASKVLRIDDESTGNAVGSSVEMVTIATPSTPSGNFAKIYAKLFGLATRYFVKADDGVELGPLGDIAAHELFQKALRGYFAAPHTANAQDGFYGMLGGAVPATHFTGTVTVASGGKDGRYGQFQTGAVSGDDAGFITGSAIVRRGATPFFKYPRFMVKVTIPDVTSYRCFIGFTDQTLATMVGSATPAGTYMGMHYSSAASANWRLINFDGAGTVRYTDTGIAVTNNTVYYLVFLDRGSLSPQMNIYDEQFALLDETTFSVFDVPANTTDMYFMWGVETQTNAARDLRVYCANVMLQGA